MIVSAIQKNILDGKVKTYDMGGRSSTSDVGGDDIVRIIKGE